MNLVKESYHCYYCEREFKDENYGTNRPLARTRDHIVPLSRGGVNNRSNLIDCCIECNNFKASFLLIEFVEVIQEYINQKKKFKTIPFALLPLIKLNAIELSFREYKITPDKRIEKAVPIKKPKRNRIPNKYWLESTFKYPQRLDGIIERMRAEPEPNFHEPS